MKLKLTFLSLVVCFVGLNFTSAQTAEGIVKKYIKAIGGLKTIKQVNSLYAEGTIESGMMSGFRIQMYSLNNTGFRINMTKNDTTRSNVMYNHYRWTETSPGNISKPVKVPDAAWEAIDLDLAGELVEYKKKGNSIAYIGKESIEGKEYYKIKITRKSGKMTYYWFDTKTYFIFQSRVVTVQNGQEKDNGTSRQADYRKTEQGSVQPFLVMQLVNDKVVSTTKFSKIEINRVNVEQSFKMPE